MQPLITFSVCVDTAQAVEELIKDLVKVHNFIKGLAEFTKTTWVEDVQMRANKMHKRLDVMTSIGELRTVLTLAEECGVHNAVIRVEELDMIRAAQDVARGHGHLVVMESGGEVPRH